MTYFPHFISSTIGLGGMQGTHAEPAQKAGPRRQLTDPHRLPSTRRFACMIGFVKPTYAPAGVFAGALAPCKASVR